MRCLACCLSLGILATLAFGQTQAKPGEAKPDREADAKPKTGPARPADEQDKSGTSKSPADATSDDGKAADAKAARAKREDQRKHNVRETLNSRVPEVNFEAAPLEKVMEWLQDYTDAIVYVRWAALQEFGITRETPITVKARDKKLSQILWVVMNEAAAESGVTLAYQASKDLFLFSTHEDLSRDMITRVYRVQDIIVDVPEFRGDGTKEGSEGVVKRTRVRRTPPPSRSHGGEIIPTDGAPAREVTTEDESLQEFVELILDTIAPASWAINGMGGEGTIFPYKGKIVIRNSLYVHQLIAGGREP
jgi:hypothetical protein